MASPTLREERTRPATWQVASLLLAVVGVGVAGYLTYVHYHWNALLCTIGSCETVQSSRYAVVAGIPVAMLGLGMYLTVLALGVARWRRPDLLSAATMAAFAIALAGTVYAGYLTYLELAVIDAVCQWCVASALLTVGVLVAEGVGVYRLLGVVPEE